MQEYMENQGLAHLESASFSKSQFFQSLMHLQGSGHQPGPSQQAVIGEDTIRQVR